MQTLTHTLTTVFGPVTVHIRTGDMIEMQPGVAVEIGPNQTARDPNGDQNWIAIPDAMLPALAQSKFAARTTRDMTTDQIIDAVS